LLRHALRCGYRAAAIDADLNQALRPWRWFKSTSAMMRRWEIPARLPVGSAVGA